MIRDDDDDDDDCKCGATSGLDGTCQNEAVKTFCRETAISCRFNLLMCEIYFANGQFGRFDIFHPAHIKHFFSEFLSVSPVDCLTISDYLTKSWDVKTVPSGSAKWLSRLQGSFLVLSLVLPWPPLRTPPASMLP